jgi:hypothetical protein
MNVDFQNLVDFLRQNQFKVMVCKPTKKQTYYSAFIWDKGIRAAFCEPNDKSYLQINGKIAADNSICFNKFSQCPLIMKIPVNDEERQTLLKHMMWLSSEEGYKWSSNFEYIDDSKLPRE